MTDYPSCAPDLAAGSEAARNTVGSPLTCFLSIAAIVPTGPAGRSTYTGAFARPNGILRFGLRLGISDFAGLAAEPFGRLAYSQVIGSLLHCYFFVQGPLSGNSLPK